MKCQHCHVNQGNVHVTEVLNWECHGSPGNQIQVKHLCEACAKRQDLPFLGAGAKASAKLWELMNLTAKIEVTTKLLSCPHCGTTQMDLRKKGRVGCPHCYEVFADDLEAMLERIHGATEHLGRLPRNANSYQKGQNTPPTQAKKGKKLAESADVNPAESQAESPAESIDELQNRLTRAIREEKYEEAAQLRDQLKGRDGSEHGEKA